MKTAAKQKESHSVRKQVWEYLEKGLKFEQEGQVGKALETYARAEDLDPNFAPVHVRIGNLLLQQEKYDQALDYLLTAKNLDPDSEEVGILLGRLYLAVERHEEAFSELKAVLNRNHENFAAHHCLANVLSNLGKPMEALQEYQKALNNSSSFFKEWIYLERGNLFKKHSLLEDALREYKTALKHNPLNPHARSQLADCYEKQGKGEEAVKHFKVLFKISREEQWKREIERLEKGQH